MKGIQTLKLHLKRSSPTILTCVAAVGVVITSVMAVRATPKAMRLLEKAMDEKGEELTKLETVMVAGPAYIPAIAIGLSTVSCIFGANIINKHNQARLTSAYALLDQSYKRYRKAANSVFGEDADSKIKTEIAKDTYVSADGYAIYDSELNQESEKFLFYDYFGQRYFTSTMASVLNAQYHINRNLTLRGEVNLNEFYTFLGVEKIDCGDDIGWSIEELMEDGIMWLDFDNHHTKMEDGMECYIVSAMYEPTRLQTE